MASVLRSFSSHVSLSSAMIFSVSWHFKRQWRLKSTKSGDGELTMNWCYYQVLSLFPKMDISHSHEWEFWKYSSRITSDTARLNLHLTLGSGSPGLNVKHNNKKLYNTCRHSWEKTYSTKLKIWTYCEWINILQYTWKHLVQSKN